MKPFTAVVLAGGASSRMGSPKALLRFGRETLIERVVRRLKPISAEVVVVSGPHLDLPPLSDARVVVDDVPSQGPVAGILYGTRVVENEFLFVCGCDHPFLEPALVGLLVRRADGADGAVPVVAGVRQPLIAAYHKRIGLIAETLLASGERRATALLEHARLFEVTEIELAAADPTGLSFLDVDTPEAYRRALDIGEASKTWE
jgi:molybdopterin-guanine dinucleotide biosynthesis protein A